MDRYRHRHGEWAGAVLQDPVQGGRAAADTGRIAPASKGGSRGAVGAERSELALEASGAGATSARTAGQRPEDPRARRPTSGAWPAPELRSR
mgnify:CR=1 FL=1